MTRIRNAWHWFWQGRLCTRCKLERTYRHFDDVLCTTCSIVEVIRWSLR